MFLLRIYHALCIPAFIFLTIAVSPFTLLAYALPSFGNIYYYALIVVTCFLACDRGAEKSRDFLFSQLAQEQKRRGKRLKILEIGPGTGGNFKYYPNGSYVSTLELNARLDSWTNEMKKKYPKLSFEKTIIGNIEDVQGVIPDGEFDVVVGTHLLCCVKDKDKGISEIHRILTPGGVFGTEEIVTYDRRKTPFKWFVQLIVRPFHLFYTLGCRAMSFDTQSFLLSHRWDVSVMRHVVTEDILIPYARSFCGLARKMPQPPPQVHIDIN